MVVAGVGDGVAEAAAEEGILEVGEEEEGEGVAAGATIILAEEAEGACGVSVFSHR